MPSSPNPLSLLRPFWPPLLCALLSVALWLWSRQLPESHWELSGPLAPTPAGLPVAAEPVSPPIPTPEPEQATATATPQEPPAAPEPAPSAPASPEPATATSEPAASTQGEVAQATPSPAPPAPEATPSPTPTEAELAGPLPQHTEEELVARASATPTPPPLGIAEIARDPRLWPKQVLLLAPVQFSVIVKGAIAGNLQMPAGRAVAVRKVNADGTVLLELPEVPGTQANAKAQATDLLVRAQALAAARQNTPEAK